MANLMPTNLTKAYPYTMGWIEISCSIVLTSCIGLKNSKVNSVQEACAKCFAVHIGVVQKLRGQDEVDRGSKNASFCPRLG